jgi:hypothetical protein
VQAAVEFLTAFRQETLAAIAAVAPYYPIEHEGRPLPDWEGRPPPGWSLVLDLSVPTAFLAALASNGVTEAEAEAVASLPANREMLAHRDALAYLPEPHPTAEDVAAMMARTGAADPLSRIWSWLDPWNGFGYADLVENADAYRRQLDELAEHGDVLTGRALVQVAAYVPEEITFSDRFALTVGWGIRGWATPAMGGLNIEHVKDDWDFLLGTLIEETFHRLQLRIVPGWRGEPASAFEDLAVARTGDAGLDALYEIAAYTALEGSANLARGDLVPEKVRAGAAEGARLLARFVDEVVEGGSPNAADELLAEGLRNNGPLYGLGWELSRRVAAAEGPRAIGRLLQEGPVAFLLAAAAYDDGELLEPAVRRALEELGDRVGAVRSPR